jgi:hypothetical protein
MLYPLPNQALQSQFLNDHQNILGNKRDDHRGERNNEGLEWID